MKMLNLAHDWLGALMPFCLGKIDRVSFGLLTPADLTRALERDPKMPRSRKLCAVPFVGKDVPSTASEFAHPDVVIGMSILAYRYEGLRWGDFALLLSRLFEEMSAEAAPSYLERPSCRKFSRWVALAGGRVRRTQRAELLNEAELSDALRYRAKVTGTPSCYSDCVLNPKTMPYCSSLYSPFLCNSFPSSPLPNP